MDLNPVMSCQLGEANQPEITKKLKSRPKK
jgi:hypothetical protein